MKRLLSATLTILLLVFNTGMTFSTHYCGGTPIESTFSLGIKDVGCTGYDLGCGMDDSKTGFTKQPCCTNDFVSLSVDDLKETNLKTQVVPFTLLAPIVNQYIVANSPSEDYSQFAYEVPPFLSNSTNLARLQVFLI